MDHGNLMDNRPSHEDKGYYVNRRNCDKSYAYFVNFCYFEITELFGITETFGKTAKTILCLRLLQKASF